MIKNNMIDVIKTAFENFENVDLIGNIVNKRGVKFAYFGKRHFGGSSIKQDIGYGGYYTVWKGFKIIECLCVGITTKNSEQYNLKNSHTMGYKIYDPFKDKEIVISEHTIVFQFNKPEIYDAIQLLGSIDDITKG